MTQHNAIEIDSLPAESLMIDGVWKSAEKDESQGPTTLK